MHQKYQTEKTNTTISPTNIKKIRREIKLKKTHNILIILTGGTICSFADKAGKRDSDVERAHTLIERNFRASGSRYSSEECVTFDKEKPLDILSENMTTGNWNILISKMRTYDYSKYDGVIILHGTDTLAYTGALLSILMAGTKIPVFLVSSQLPPDDEKANGNANFRAAAELIINGIEPNIYAVYRNTETDGLGETQRMYIHYCSHLLQCANRSENFYSPDMAEVSQENAVFEGKSSGGERMYLYHDFELSPCVLRIIPYVGIDYEHYCMKGVKAILHGTYHSSTMAVTPYKDDESKRYTSQAILSLKKRCDECKPPIPLFLEHCHRDAYNYISTGIILKCGAIPVWTMTSEMTYVKLLVGCALGYEGEKLNEFMNREINDEFVYRD